MLKDNLTLNDECIFCSLIADRFDMIDGVGDEE